MALTATQSSSPILYCWHRDQTHYSTYSILSFQLKLDGYRDELARGRTLSEEQQLAASRYNEVVANLDLTREFITAFEKIGSEASKEEKKRKKKETFERQQLEVARFKEVFMIQVFSNL